jgi:UDP-2-acetamido-2-deoxy-ribo-hexuluronate aminotransferase
MNVAQIKFCDLASEYREIKDAVDRRINSVLNHGQFILGPEVHELEERLADYVGVTHCITVSSGTDALLISLMALGVGPGHEVITTEFSYIATADVILRLGATPIFVDVEADTALIDVSKIEESITSRTRAIIPVSLYGQPCEMDKINDIARRNGGIPVVEDAAQSFGSTYRGRKSCGLSLIGCTSFFPTKPLGAFGDGGAVFTDDDSLAELVRSIRVHGQAEKYNHERLGITGRLDTLQAAVLIEKLKVFDTSIERRRSVARAYSDRLLGQTSVSEMTVRDGNTSVFGQFTIRANDRDDLKLALDRAGVPSVIHYPRPLSQQPLIAMNGLQERDSRHAARLSKIVLSLPMHPGLGLREVEWITEVVTEHVW